MAALTPTVRGRAAGTRCRTYRRLCTIPQLSVVVVNYQRWSDTVALVRDLEQSESVRSGAAEIIVIDNHSVDHRLARTLRRSDAVTLKRCSKNRGFARAVNAGSRLSSGDWFLFLNPDMSAPEGFLDRALELAEDALRNDPTLGILGFQVRNTDGTMQGSTGPLPTFAGTLARLLLPRCRRKYSQPPAQRCSVPWVTGCCLMIRRECFQSLGGFDRRFFLYYEDVDLCRRAVEGGWSVWHEPAAHIVHHRPLHARRVNPVLHLLTRHALLTYASRHWNRWQTRTLARLVRLESWIRQRRANRHNDRRLLRLVAGIAQAIGDGRASVARRILQQVVEHGESEERTAQSLRRAPLPRFHVAASQECC
jgi:GT2 family glycosyltransferase